MIYFQLLASIVFEIIATSLLKKSDGFTHIPATAGMIIGYICSFYFLSLVIRVLPIGIVYATWSGLGIVLISIVGYFVFQQKLNLPVIFGLTLIISGVVIVNLFSPTIH